MYLDWMSFAIFFHLVNQKDKDILQYFSELSALNNSSVSKLCHLIAPASYQTICKCGISQLVGLFWWFSFPVRNDHLFLLCFISFRELFVQLLYTFPSSYPHYSPMRCFPDCILQMLVDYDTWTCPWQVFVFSYHTCITADKWSAICFLGQLQPPLTKWFTYKFKRCLFGKKYFLTKAWIVYFLLATCQFKVLS